MVTQDVRVIIDHTYTDEADGAFRGQKFCDAIYYPISAIPAEEEIERQCAERVAGDLARRMAPPVDAPAPTLEPAEAQAAIQAEILQLEIALEEKRNQLEEIIPTE